MPPTILIVDDDPLLCRLFTTALENRGYAAHAVYSGHDALTFIEQNQVDALVLDIMMADMDGIAVLNTLRAMPIYQDLPIIVLSARADAASKHRGMVAGATAYLYKPITPDALAEHLVAALAHRSGPS